MRRIPVSLVMVSAITLTLLAPTEGTPAAAQDALGGPTSISGAVHCQGVPATIVGTKSSDVIDGTPGPDVIVTMGGNDLIDAGAGDDLICAGAGDDHIDAGDGADRIYAGSGHDLALGGDGDDTIFLGSGTDIGFGDTGYTQVDGSTQGVTGGGNDSLFGGPGHDVLYGEDGDDRVEGGTGDDQLRGGAGDDRVLGFNGNDEAHGDQGDDKVVGGQGVDELHGGAGSDDVRGDGGADFLTGGDGEDHLTGGSGPDTISGDADNDRIEAGSGDDTVEAGGGNDSIDGGRGNDRLNGDAGDDHILGGYNNDDLDGGDGADVCDGQQGQDTQTRCENTPGTTPTPTPTPGPAPTPTPTPTPTEPCAAPRSPMTSGTCDFLTAFFDAAGPTWNATNNPTPGSDPCDWLGVTCANDHVSIDLSGHDIDAPMPNQIRHLINVTDLDLSGNRLTGTMPNGFRTVALTTFDLSGSCVDDAGIRAVGNWVDHPGYSPGDRCPIGSRFPPCTGIVSTMTGPECLALVMLYRTTGGDTWTNDTGWLTESDPCTWFGVSCKVDGTTTTISLPDNGLTGWLPDRLAGLERLGSLNLAGNKLTGDLPKELWDLEFLHEVDLSGSCVDDGGPEPDANVVYRSGDDCADAAPPTCMVQPTSASAMFDSTCAALLRFYASTNGDNWTNNDGWLTDADPCTWHGVACGFLRVGLNLQDNNLTGELPPELFEWAGLRSVNLAFNRISGVMPPSAATAGLGTLRLLGNCIDDTGVEVDAGNYTPGTHCGLISDVAECNGLITEFTATSCEVLVSVFMTMGGSEWTNNTGWLTRTDPCTWFGVTCRANTDSAPALRLPNNNVTGPLDPALTDMDLGWLDLSNNGLESPWPPKFDWVRWELLDLGGNCVDPPGPNFFLNVFVPGTACGGAP